MPDAVVVLDWRRWVADCPHPDCTNAREVRPGQTVLQCQPQFGPKGEPGGGCGRESPLAWPGNPARVLASVAKKPDRDAHWRPPVEDEGAA